MKDRNIVAKVPNDVYIKLHFIADKMEIPLPVLMGQILNNEFFLEAVDNMFEVISKVPDKK